MTRVPVVLACAAALAGGCQKKAEPEAVPGKPGAPTAPPQSAEELKTPLAKIDDVTITLAEFQDRINRQSPYIRARYTSLEQKKEFLDSLVRFEVLAKGAAPEGERYFGLLNSVIHRNYDVSNSIEIGGNNALIGVIVNLPALRHLVIKERNLVAIEHWLCRERVLERLEVFKDLHPREDRALDAVRACRPDLEIVTHEHPGGRGRQVSRAAAPVLSGR